MRVQQVPKWLYKRYSEKYVLESYNKTTDARIHGIKESGKMYHHPIDGHLYILSYIYHKSIAF